MDLDLIVNELDHRDRIFKKKMSISDIVDIFANLNKKEQEDMMSELDHKSKDVIRKLKEGGLL